MRHRKLVESSGATCALAIVALLAALSGCGGEATGSGEHSDHGEHAEQEFERGPHGGRLLEDGELAVELTIFEEGVPPELRAYLYRDGEPRSPDGSWRASGSSSLTTLPER